MLAPTRQPSRFHRPPPCSLLVAVEFGDDSTGSGEFRSLSRNGKIPAIFDPDGPDGEPHALFESGSTGSSRSRIG